jgi:hypothetical protein
MNIYILHTFGGQYEDKWTKDYYFSSLKKTIEFSEKHTFIDYDIYGIGYIKVLELDTNEYQAIVRSVALKTIDANAFDFEYPQAPQEFYPTEEQIFEDVEYWKGLDYPSFEQVYDKFVELDLTNNMSPKEISDALYYYDR